MLMKDQNVFLWLTVFFFWQQSFSVSEGKSAITAITNNIDKERDFLISEQCKKNRYHRFVSGKLIVKQGILEKKKVFIILVKKLKR